MANTEAPNDLLSNQRISILDVVSEGTTAGFWRQSGVSGNSPLCSIYLDDIPIINGDGSANFNISGQGFYFDYTTGTSNQACLSGFDRVEAIVPLPANPRVTFPPVNAGFPRPVVVAFNTTMYPDAEAVKVTMRIPALFTVDTANGNTNRFNVGWQVEIQLNGGEWQFIETQFIQGKNTSPYLKTLVYTLPKTTPRSNYYEWKLRIRRTTRFIDSQRTAHDLFVDSVAVVSSNGYTYPMTALVGLSLSADQFAGLPSRAYDIKGIQVAVPLGYTPTRYDEIVFTRACDYDAGNRHIGLTTQSSAQMAGIVPGTIVSGPGIPPGATIVSIENGPSYFFTIDRDPTTTVTNTTLSFNASSPGTITAASYPGVWLGAFGPRVWTNNPAWIFYDLCTNKRYGLGNYIRPEWVDKWTLYQISQVCDTMVDDGKGGLEPMFTCNVAIQTADEAYTVLNQLVSVFRGMLYWANGRIFPVGPENRDYVFDFTNANVIGGAFSYSDSPRNTRSTVCKVKWTDPDNLFRPSVERVEDPNGIAKYGVIEKEITAFATTSRGQAIRMANWVLTVEQALTETISFQTDQEGLYLRPGDIINVYDNYRKNKQQGGRIADFDTGRSFIVLDKEITLLSGNHYWFSAVIPAATVGTGITGSNQISSLRASQVETRRVVTYPPTGTFRVLNLESGFSPGLFRGSPWILSASGSLATVFDQASQYKILIASEPDNGIIQVVGVQYNTGINSIVNNNYSSEVSPVLSGDLTTPAAPTNFTATRITGLLGDNSFYSYIDLSWTPSISANAAYNRVSGKLMTHQPSLLGLPPQEQNSLPFTPTGTGLHTFSIAAFNANGVGSSFVTTTYTVTGTNPFGSASSLSGIIISEDYDIYSHAPLPIDRPTGYIGSRPTFSWAVRKDENDLEVPQAQFVTGWRVRVLKITDETVNLGPDIFIGGKENLSWKVDDRFLYTGTSVKPLRAFTLSVDAMDSYGSIISGARLAVNNIQPRAPVTSGFVGFDNGVNYTVTPNAADEADISGVYIWTNTGSSFVPTYTNATYTSANLAGFAPASGSIFFTWFALVDSYGPSGSIAANGDYGTRIYGPLSGNSIDIVDDTNLVTRARLEATGITLLNRISEVSGALRSGITDIWSIVCSDEATPLSTGMEIVTWRIPCNAILTKVRAELTLSGNGVTTVDFRQSGTSILSQKLTIDANETTSVTAASGAVISNSNLADEARFYIDLLGVPENAAGLKVKLFIKRDNEV